MTKHTPGWDYRVEAEVRDLTRALPVVREAAELLEWILLLADQGFLQPPSGLRPGVWDSYLARMRAVVEELH